MHSSGRAADLWVCLPCPVGAWPRSLLWCLAKNPAPAAADWGTVCNNDFDREDAEVACRQVNVAL